MPRGLDLTFLGGSSTAENRKILVDLHGTRCHARKVPVQYRGSAGQEGRAIEVLKIEATATFARFHAAVALATSSLT
jgi:hypothetical protein